MIKLLVGIKKYLLSNIEVRRLILHRRELVPTDSQFSNPNDSVSFSYQARIEPNMVKLFNYETAIEDDTAGIIVKFDGFQVGFLLFNLKSKGRVSQPFNYEFKLTPKSAYAYALFIKKEFRSKGLAKMLYQQSFKVLKESFRYVDVLTEEANFIANNMVRELNFKEIGRFALIKIFGIKLTCYFNNFLINAIINFLAHISRITYQCIRLPVTLFEKFDHIKNKLFFSLFLIKSSNCQDNTVVAYFCRRDPSEAMVDKIFPDGHGVKKIKTFYMLQLLDEVNKIIKSSNLLIIEDNFKNLRKKYLNFDDVKLIPRLVAQKISCPEGSAKLQLKKNRSLDSDFSAIKKNSYECLFTRDLNLLKFFYKNMYLPYAYNRHQLDRFTDDFDSMLRIFKKGGLILLKHKNKFLSGSVVELNHKNMHVKYLGILNGDVQLLKKDVLSSLYYFWFNLAQDRSIRTISLGFSKGFLNDGVLRYKAKWSAKVSFDKQQGRTFLLKIVNLTPSIRSFLLHNPFISIEESKNLVGNIYLDDESLKEKDNYINRYKVDGLDKLRVIFLNGAKNPVREEIINCKS